LTVFIHSSLQTGTGCYRDCWQKKGFLFFSAALLLVLSPLLRDRSHRRPDYSVLTNLDFIEV